MPNTMDERRRGRKGERATALLHYSHMEKECGIQEVVKPSRILQNKNRKQVNEVSKPQCKMHAADPSVS